MKRNEVVGEPGASPSSATLHSYIFNNVFCLNCLYFCVQNQRQRQNQTITTFNATRNTGYHWFSLPALKPFGLSISLLLLILPQIHLKCFALFCPSQWKMEDNKMLPNRGTRKLQTHHTHTHNVQIQSISHACSYGVYGERSNRATKLVEITWKRN